MWEIVRVRQKELPRGLQLDKEWVYPVNTWGLGSAVMTALQMVFQKVRE